MRTVLPEVHAQEQEMGSHKPRRAKITKNIIDKFGPTARCTKCRAITRGESGMEAVGHSAACRERIEDLMKANPDFRERVDRADERINKMPAEYLEKKDKEASEEQQSTKRARTEAHSTARSSCDPLPQQEEVGDAEMGIPEANEETSKRTLEELASEERHARRQRVEHLEEGLRGHVVGELHRRGGVVQGSSVSAQLCKFSIDDQGVDAISSKRWDFSKEVDRVTAMKEKLTTSHSDENLMPIQASLKRFKINENLPIHLTISDVFSPWSDELTKSLEENTLNSFGEVGAPSILEILASIFCFLRFSVKKSFIHCCISDKSVL